MILEPRHFGSRVRLALARRGLDGPGPNPVRVVLERAARWGTFVPAKETPGADAGAWPESRGGYGVRAPGAVA